MMSWHPTRLSFYSESLALSNGLRFFWFPRYVTAVEDLWASWKLVQKESPRPPSPFPLSISLITNISRECAVFFTTDRLDT